MNFLGCVRRVCFGALAVLALVTPCAAETFVFDFPTSLDGWEPGWHIDSTTGTPGVISHSTERGYLDLAPQALGFRREIENGRIPGFPK
jgi:hypothetical protein